MILMWIMDHRRILDRAAQRLIYNGLFESSWFVFVDPCSGDGNTNRSIVEVHGYAQDLQEVRLC